MGPNKVFIIIMVLLYVNPDKDILTCPYYYYLLLPEKHFQVSILTIMHSDHPSINQSSSTYQNVVSLLVNHCHLCISEASGI